MEIPLRSVTQNAAGMRERSVHGNQAIDTEAWAQLDSNQRPEDYESPALTN